MKHQEQTRYSFNDLYAHELELLALAEKQMVALLPRLAKGADTAELKEALQQQCGGCKDRLAMLKQLLQALREKGRLAVGNGIEALLDECLELLEKFPQGNLRDAAMIAHVQRAEHYRTAAYASVRDYARLLGHKPAGEALDQAYKATIAASKTLGGIAIQVDAEAYVDTREEGT